MILRKKLFALAALVLLALGSKAPALDPAPTVYQGFGYSSWMLPQDAKSWSLENLMERLRDKETREKTMLAVGFQKVKLDRNWILPDIGQPITVVTRFLGFERRKLAVMTLPIEGRHAWFLILFSQKAGGEDYWRPVQFFRFDTDPAVALETSYHDVLGDQIDLLRVKHLGRSDIYGTRRMDTLFKYDEHRLRQVYQETDDYYRSGKFQGEAMRLKQSLAFKGDQHIHRSLDIKTYGYMQGPEFFQYEEKNVKPLRVEKTSESFAWNPANFSFYEPRAEQEKLKSHASPLVRAEAARRLGEMLKTSSKQLEASLLKDKNPNVRVQCALALEAIGDPAARPALKKALANLQEPEQVQEAFQRAYDSLTRAKEKKK